MSELVSFLESATFFGTFLCLGAYFLGVWIHKKIKLAIFNPLLLADVFVIGLLVICKIDYKAFQASAQPLSFFLTPATVCLAIPLYNQLQKLKQNWKAVMLGILSGVVSSGVCIFLMCLVFGMTHAEYASFLPKSITTAIGMSVSEELGGYVSLTIGAILITGLLGNIAGKHILKLVRIEEPVAKGIALGSSSHAFGTTLALTIGEVEGAMSSLSIVVSGLCTVVGAQVFAMLL